MPHPTSPARCVWGYCGQPLQINGSGCQGVTRFWAERLGPRAFTISGINSFRGSLVGSHLFSRTNFKLKRAAALAELRQLLSA